MLRSKMTVVAAATAMFFLCVGFTQPSETAPVMAQESLQMSPGLFKTKGRLDAIFPDFDFDAQCGVESFRLVRVSKRADPLIVQNMGGDFVRATTAIIQQARPGDFYFFEDIRVRCPEDIATRKLGAIVVEIR